MRSQTTGRQASKVRGSVSLAKLLAIVGFSAGLLAAYIFVSGPQTHVNRRSAIESNTKRDIVRSQTSGDSVVSSNPVTVGTPTAPQVTSIERPPPLGVAVGVDDQRHPQNIKTIIAQGSSQDEHKSSVLESMKQQQSDTSEASTKAANAGTTYSPTTSSSGSSNSSTTTTAETTGSTTITTTATAALKHATETLKTANAPTKHKTTSSTTKTATSGTTANAKQPGDTIHTLFTSNGSPYQNFQARIMIGTYKLMQKMPGGEKHVAMTRILHRQTPDDIMDQVDTFRANPVQPECDTWCWFPVADRANAVQQWINAVDKDPSLQKAPWLLMLESDYVWIKPLQAPGDAYDPKVPGLSFAYDYIQPRNNVVEKLLQEHCPTCKLEDVPNSGPAPVLMRFRDLKAATPLWEKISLWIEQHEDAKKQLGWVREMYAWDIGVAAGKCNILNQGPPATTLISQPPHDAATNNATMYHYTWGSIFKESGKEIWKFDKRVYVDNKDVLKVPRIPLPPPWKEGITLQDHMPISKELYGTIVDMLTTMNNAIDTLDDLSGRATKPAA